jgi:hypothetical protein
MLPPFPLPVPDPVYTVPSVFLVLCARGIFLAVLGSLDVTLVTVTLGPAWAAEGVKECFPPSISSLYPRIVSKTLPNSHVSWF